MLPGEAAALARPVALPGGVTLRRIDDLPHPAADVARAAVTLERAFGHSFGTDGLLRRMGQRPDLIQLWVAEAGGEVVCAGRLEFVPSSDLAGLWAAPCPNGAAGASTAR